ncbi:MAG: hypothetical protein HC898_06315 [Phycisphaerales bacterium]|nr:hypothetical protein [Phycisphaerales bacterium]
MILAYHVIFACYGFWLPNDPRGSGSDFVRQSHLKSFGPPTKVTTRHSVAHQAHDQKRRLVAKTALQRPPVQLTGEQALHVAKGFAAYSHRGSLVIHACCIMPDHVHMVLARHRHPIERLVNLLKGAATRELIQAGVHPLSPAQRANRDSIWAANTGWVVYLNTPQAIRRCVKYVEMNPVKAGLRPQRWSFCHAVC